MKVSDNQSRRIYLARVRGFCAGVRRAIETVNQCLEAFGPPVYVFHAIVHNRHVVEEFEQQGVVFVEDLSSVPPNAPLVFSAHGVAKAVEEEAHRRGIAPVIDATCPLVKRVHRQVQDSCNNGKTVVLVGHREHPEIVGVMGQVTAGALHVVSTADEVHRLPAAIADTSIVCIAQTTLTQQTINAVAEALKQRFPQTRIQCGPTVCYASANRQDAVRELAGTADCVIIVGSSNSSNANRLREVAEAAGTQAFLIDSAEDFKEDWLAGARGIGISAGASTPEIIVTDLLQRLAELGWREIVEVGAEEKRIGFRLPPLTAPTPVAKREKSND